MLRRKALDRMISWKNSPSHRALLVTGARQIGKTYLVREFARGRYERFVEINFLLDPSAKSLFDTPRSTDDIYRRLTLMADHGIVAGNTLIFLDEIQECPEALTAIKGLVDAGSVDFVLSGSLLGVELRSIRSNPVGYVLTLEMFPLDFEEFCWACGVDESVFGYLGSCLQSESTIDTPVHNRLESLFCQYLVVGGMPDAVETYVESNDLFAVRDVQESVRDWYRTDISKYCPDSDKLKAKDAFDLVPAELNNPNKRFILKQLDEGARFRGYEDAFLWLTRANVALAAFNVAEPRPPLLASKERRLFKLFYSDIGLLTASYSRAAALSLLNGSSTVNHGSTYENAVAQELVAHGYSLYYFSNKRLGELDFVVEDRDGRILPLEVKSGKGYKRHRAMNNVLEVANWGIGQGWVLGPTNIERDGKVLYLPTYMICMMQNV